MTASYNIIRCFPFKLSEGDIADKIFKEGLEPAELHFGIEKPAILKTGYKSYFIEITVKEKNE